MRVRSRDKSRRAITPLDLQLFHKDASALMTISNEGGRRFKYTARIPMKRWDGALPWATLPGKDGRRDGYASGLGQ